MQLKEADSIQELKGIGEKTAALFHKMGVFTIGELIRYFPRDYVNYPEMTEPKSLFPGNMAAIKLKIISQATVTHVKKLSIVSAVGEADNVRIRLSWFNMPYLKKAIVPGLTRVFYGKAEVFKTEYVLRQSAIFKEEEYEALVKAPVPVYPLTKGLTSKGIGKAVLYALEALSPCTASDSKTPSMPCASPDSKTPSMPGVSPSIEEPDSAFSTDYLTFEEREKLDLMDEWSAIKAMHFPSDKGEVIRARDRLVFDEFLSFLLSVRRLKESNAESGNDFPMFETAEAKRVVERLPYKLTGAQEEALSDIYRDLSGKKAMNRLIQGDVGSGKTIVAILALITAAANGYQGAIMAPTEVLAVQHAKEIKRIIDDNKLPFSIVLLTGSLPAKEKREAKRQLSSGEARIAVGTHALLQEDVVFQNLALVVTDEQHRFGVMQRRILSAKSESAEKLPHVLVMSATPIPRTLAIILYGDLDISVMGEKPSMRKPIKNCVVGTDYRERAYRFIKKEVEAGHQAYVICPKVEAEGEDGFSGASDMENVEDYAKKLREIYGDRVRVGHLHGRMKPKEKREIMERFSAHEIDILVSTTVIEVGVDVQNATVMMIENAERFGLSTLHQIRGRVGRGDSQSYCIFINSSESPDKNERLNVLNHTNDGFEIASEDLKLRGPGDIFGLRQSGDLLFKLADIYQDAKILKKAASFADRLKEGRLEELSEALPEKPLINNITL